MDQQDWTLMICGMTGRRMNATVVRAILERVAPSADYALIAADFSDMMNEIEVDFIHTRS